MLLSPRGNRVVIETGADPAGELRRHLAGRYWTGGRVIDD